MKAVVGSETGGYEFVDNVDVPQPKAGQMLCRVESVALNPVDYKITDFSRAPGAVGGCDFAGTIVELGEGVKRFQVGDRVLGLTFGLNNDDKTAGAFAEYVIAIEDLSCHIPDALSFIEASSMGLAIATAGLALFETPGLQLRKPGSGGDKLNVFVLVSGGATATGTMATQLLKSAGYLPIVTCSPANNEICQSYGAYACFDYKSTTCGGDIRDYTDGNLAFVMDCVTNADTMRMCYEAIGSSGGSYISLEPTTPQVKYTRRDVRADWLMAHSILGVPLKLRGAFGRPRTPGHRTFGAQWFLLVEKMLQKGQIRNHPLEIREGGLANMPDIVEDFREGTVRARKLVVPLVA